MAHVLASELRKSLLQKAFSGEFCLFDSNDTPVDKTLLDIKELKNKSKIRDPKYDKSFNNLLFEIPDHWEWVKLPQIATSSLGKTLNGSKDKGIEKPYLCSINVYWTGIDLKTVKKSKFSDADIEKYCLQKGDMLICEGGDVGKTIIWEKEDEMYYQNALHRVRFFGGVNQYYMRYLLMFYKRIGLLDDSSKGMTIKHLVQGSLNALPIPLPPIEEQARIVARVDELMAMIDEYEKLENQLVELKRDFPGDMKDAILLAAMQGKLTEQLATDSHIAIKADEINSCYDLIEIPENWQWNTIDSVIDVSTGLTFSKEDQRSAGNNTLRIMRGGNILDNYSYSLFDNDVYVSYRDKYIPLEIGDVLSPAVTSMEKMCKVAYIDKPLENTTAGGFVYILRSKNNEILNPKYMMYFFSSNFNRSNCNENIHKSGQAFYNLKKSGMVTQPIPIPPIEEQNRIVEKLEELLPLCDSLKQ